MVDIDGDGVELLHANRGVDFDLFGWNSKVRTSWIGADDAFLALDSNGNGTIDSGRELFANFIGETGWDEVPTGFENLAQHDRAVRGGNGDGVIDEHDSVFANLRLWRDSDADGESDPGELHTLPKLGVAAIGLAYIEDGGSNPALSHRALVFHTADGLSRTGAPLGTVQDAWFTYGKSRRR